MPGSHFWSTDTCPPFGLTMPAAPGVGSYLEATPSDGSDRRAWCRIDDIIHMYLHAQNRPIRVLRCATRTTRLLRVDVHTRRVATYRGISVPVSSSTLYGLAPTTLSPRDSTMSSYPTRCRTTQRRLNRLRDSTWENAGHARRCEGVPEPHSMLGRSFLTYKLTHSPDAALRRHIHRNCWNMEMSKSAKVRSADRERLFVTHVRKARTRTHV